MHNCPRVKRVPVIIKGTLRLFKVMTKVVFVLGSTVSGWVGWLSCFVLYWQKTVFGWFGCSTFSTRIKLG